MNVRHKKTRFGTNLGALILLTLLTGCAMGPNYQRPTVNAPADYRFATTQPTTQPADSLAELPWWELFNDPELQDLIRTALANGYDVRVAATRVEQARQFAAQVNGQFMPSVGYKAGVARGQNQFLGQPSDSGFQTATAAAGVLNAAWEIDLWGRVRRMNEAAQAQYLATENARRGVMLSLVTDVAQAYLELLELDLQMQVAQRATESFNGSLKLFTDRLEGGVANKLATSRAQAAASSAAADIPELQRLIALKEDQINLLLGRSPGPIPRHGTLLLETLPPEVPAGLPSALLERRPDVREAEQLLRSANAQIGVAQANFFPQIGLTAMVGKVSPDVSTITGGKANAWAIGLNAAGPIFQGGALLAQYRSAKAAWEQAKLQYEQTAINAFREVSDALISREKFAESRAQLAQSVTAYREAADTAMERFRLGRANYYEVLATQQLQFPAESALAQSELNQRLATVQLYKALGGGWHVPDDQWKAGPTGPTGPTPPTTMPATAPQTQPAINVSRREPSHPPEAYSLRR